LIFSLPCFVIAGPGAFPVRLAVLVILDPVHDEGKGKALLRRSSLMDILRIKDKAALSSITGNEYLYTKIT